MSYAPSETSDVSDDEVWTEIYEHYNTVDIMEKLKSMSDSKFLRKKEPKCKYCENIVSLQSCEDCDNDSVPGESRYNEFLDDIFYMLASNGKNVECMYMLSKGFRVNHNVLELLVKEEKLDLIHDILEKYGTTRPASYLYKLCKYYNKLHEHKYYTKLVKALKRSTSEEDLTEIQEELDNLPKEIANMLT